MSVSCRGECEINHEGINYVGFKQVRYNQGMRACYKCQKAWYTNDTSCGCCHSKLRIKRRSKVKRNE